MKMTYREFYDFFSRDGYGDSEIHHLFHAVKAMDRESRIWVLRWFDKGEIPKEEIEGVTAEYLMKTCGYRPINAFIILDWLKNDPQAAKYFVLKVPSTIPPDEMIGSEIRKIMEKEGMEERESCEKEDLTDIGE